MLDMASADALLIPQGAVADLSAIAAQVAAHITPLAVRDHRSIQFIDNHPAPMEGHTEAIGRALRNLVENALKYTPENTSVDVIAGPGPVITVRDHGPGIANDKRALVTKRFWRGDRSCNEGSGLGLAIASRVAEAHGGGIEISDAEGGGAIIRLRLRDEFLL
jgi:signal transduction histidine kinase